MTCKATVIELKEHRTSTYGRELVPEAVAWAIRERFERYVDVTPDFFGKTWSLTPGGCVGYIPISNDYALSIQPKVPLVNLFRMLEVAYNADLKFFDGGMGCKTIQDVFERLAVILSKRILRRAQKGFYRSYVEFDEPLAYVRGRVDLERSMRKTGMVELHCHFQDHTGDIDDNQILLWTLYCIARTGQFSDASLRLVRAAYRSLHGIASIQPVTTRACANRTYNRLNMDYQPLHGLCRFFLERTGPTAELGDRAMLPFLIDMPTLYELFVAEWLRICLPPQYALRTQERVDVSHGVFQCRIDLVIYDVSQGKAVCVLDTKYKDHEKPSQADIYQAVTYATLKECSDAILIYPVSSIHPFYAEVGTVRVRSLSFALDTDLEERGNVFLKTLLENLVRCVPLSVSS